MKARVVLPGAFVHQGLRVGLEHLDHVHLAGAQRGGVLRHGAPAGELNCRRGDPGPAQIVPQADPRRGHLRDRRERPPGQLRGREAGVRGAPDEVEGVASHHLAECGVPALRILIERGEDPQRPAPRHLARAGSDRLQGFARLRGDLQLDLESLRLVRAERARRVKRRVEDRAEVFDQDDGHAPASKG